MRNGKYAARRTSGTKVFTLVLALVLTLGCVVGGTVAWLTDTTGAVTNTFTVSDIDIELKESENLNLKMIPGWTITKDPKATVKANSENCYLFVQLKKSTNYDTFLNDYTVADGWTLLEAGVYYRVVNTSTDDQTFDVLKDNKVTVKDTVTKSDMNGLTPATYPTLTVKAFAVQYNNSNSTNFTPAKAWEQIPASERLT